MTCFPRADRALAGQIWVEFARSIAQPAASDKPLRPFASSRRCLRAIVRPLSGREKARRNSIMSAVAEHEKSAPAAASDAAGEPADTGRKVRLRPLVLLLPYLKRYRLRVLFALFRPDRGGADHAGCAGRGPPHDRFRLFRREQPDRQIFRGHGRGRGRARAREFAALLSRHDARRTDRGGSAQRRVRASDAAVGGLF